jgi:lipoate---protein ligase
MRTAIGQDGASPLDGLICFEQTLSSVPEDLALDEVLLIEADQGRGAAVLRFWEPRTYAVVLGASRRLSDEVQADACRIDGVPIVRRSSGGGTVVVGPGTLNVTLVLPESMAPGLWAVETAQRYVLERIAEAIRGLGRPVSIEGRGDLTLGGRKCGGSAQRRLKSWFMVHCSILVDFPIERIVRYLAIPEKQPEYRAGRTHREFLCNLDLPCNMVMNTICKAWSPGSSLSAAPAWPKGSLDALLAEKYANPAWIERF